jgi:hypothetical protein
MSGRRSVSIGIFMAVQARARMEEHDEQTLPSGSWFPRLQTDRVKFEVYSVRRGS